MVAPHRGCPPSIQTLLRGFEQGRVRCSNHRAWVLCVVCVWRWGGAPGGGWGGGRFPGWTVGGWEGGREGGKVGGWEGGREGGAGIGGGNFTCGAFSQVRLMCACVRVCSARARVRAWCVCAAPSRRRGMHLLTSAYPRALTSRRCRRRRRRRRRHTHTSTLPCSGLGETAARGVSPVVGAATAVRASRRRG